VWVTLPKLKNEAEDFLSKGFLKEKMAIQLEKTYEWIHFTKVHAQACDWECALEKGREKEQEYSVTKSLGSGAFAQVYFCKELSTGKCYAYKEFGEQNFRAFLREERAFNTLGDARYLVKAHDSFVTDYFRGVIVLEYLELELIQGRSFSLPEVRKFGFQLISSLACFEKAGLIHADIKPGNLHVGIKTGLLLVFDLDLTIPCDEVDANTVIQTLWYRAPEVILGRNVDCSADIWSAGCVLGELFLGKCLLIPLHNKEQCQIQKIVKSIGLPSEGYLEDEEAPRAKDFFDKTITGSYVCKEITLQNNAPNEIFKKISEYGKMTNEPDAHVNEFWDLTRQLICYENRLSASQALAHPFFSEFTFLECVMNQHMYCLFELIGDGNIVLSLNLSKAPHHSMQSFRRSSDNHYILKLTDLKTTKTAIQQNVQLQSGDILELDKLDTGSKKD
jgi:negative regulator of PHO system